MPSGEHERPYRRDSDHPDSVGDWRETTAGHQPDSRGGQLVVPEPLAAFLRSSGPLTALYHPAETGTAVVAKLSRIDLDRLRGPIPIHLRHLLYHHPAAPVLRTVLTFYDSRTAPLALELFINVADHQQREDFAMLGVQTELLLLFLDETITHRLTKRIRGFPQPEVFDLIEAAIDLLAAQPRGTFDFDQAKQAVLETTTL